MTTQVLLAACRRLGIQLDVDGALVTYAAAPGVMTPELIDALRVAKPELLQVLPRLAGMRASVGQVPIPCSRLESCGGPGRCFSCGDRHEHPQAYGRCTWCSIAVEAFYATQHADEDGIVVAADAPQGRPA